MFEFDIVVSEIEFCLGVKNYMRNSMFLIWGNLFKKIVECNDIWIWAYLILLII